MSSAPAKSPGDARYATQNNAQQSKGNKIFKKTAIKKTENKKKKKISSYNSRLKPLSNPLICFPSAFSDFNGVFYLTKTLGLLRSVHTSESPFYKMWCGIFHQLLFYRENVQSQKQLATFAYCKLVEFPFVIDANSL